MTQNIRHRIPHIMKQTRTIHHPSSFLFFDTETQDAFKGKNKHCQRHELWFGWIWGFRYENKRITREIRKRFTTFDEFYEIVDSRLDKCRPLYLMAHNLGFDLTIVDWFVQTTNRGFELNYAVMEDPPTMFSYQWKEGKIIVLDTHNIWKCSVADMGKSLGIAKLTMPDRKAGKKAWDDYCFRDVEILGKQVINLLDFLTDYDLGSFGISAPSIAMSAYKHRFMEHEIYIHDRNQILDLERECYYGGLVENFYIGKSNGKRVYYVDVNSLYPAMMLKDFPVKLVESMTHPALPDVRVKLHKYGACARVKLRCTDTTYPKRYQKRLCQVRGLFETYLCGDELKRAIECNHVAYVGEIAYYEMAPIFKSYVEYLWTMRKNFKAEGDYVREQLIKLFLNSLYGKFGMKGYTWYDFSSSNLEAYYTLMGADLPKEYRAKDFQPIIDHDRCIWNAIGLEYPIQLRYVSGTLQIQFPLGEHTESFCAVAAFVTAYAREHLKKMIAICGHKQVLYCDTDSLFVFKTGYNRLRTAGELSNTELGKLKLEGMSTKWVFYNAKDYTFDHVIKLKGIRHNAIKVDENTYEQDQFEGLKSVLKRGSQPYIEIRRIRKRVSHLYQKGTPTKSNWVEPFTLSD